MALKHPRTDRARRALLAGLLGTVLAGATIAAWLLQWPSSRRVGTADGILSQLRTEGLDKHWPKDLTIEWYLVRQGDQPLGWMATATGRTADGRFVGAHVDVHSLEKSWAQEQWTLDGKVTDVHYEALAVSARGQRLATLIDLKRGTVKVRSPSQSAQAQAPANYMPEGTFDLLVRLVAASRADAQFKLVFNNRQNIPGTVRFDTVRIRHIERAPRVDGSWVDRVGVSGVRTSRGLSQTYELDRAGHILRKSLDATGMQWERVTQSDVVAHYPNAPGRLLLVMPPVLREQARDLLGPGLQSPLPQRIGPADKLRI